MRGILQHVTVDCRASQQWRACRLWQSCIGVKIFQSQLCSRNSSLTKKSILLKSKLTIEIKNTIVSEIKKKSKITTGAYPGGRACRAEALPKISEILKTKIVQKGAYVPANHCNLNFEVLSPNLVSGYKNGPMSHRQKWLKTTHCQMRDMSHCQK